MRFVTRAEAKALGLKRYFTGKPCKHGHVSERMTSGGNCLTCFNAWRSEHPERIREIRTKWDAENGALYRRRYYQANSATILQSSRRWYENNRERAALTRRRYAVAHAHGIKAQRRGYYAANRECTIRRAVAWKRANPEKARQQRLDERAQRPHLSLARQRKYREANRDSLREKGREYHATNPGRVIAAVAKRRSLKLKAVPIWLTKTHRRQMRTLYEEAAVCTRLTGVRHHVDHIQPLQGRDRCGLHVPWNLQIMTALENSAKGNKAA